jgi:hypothetical protein
MGSLLGTRNSDYTGYTITPIYETREFFIGKGTADDPICQIFKEEPLECIICTEKIYRFQQLAGCSGCTNVYHYSCCEGWCRFNHSCPMCRKPF